MHALVPIIPMAGEAFREKLLGAAGIFAVPVAPFTYIARVVPVFSGAKQEGR